MLDSLTFTPGLRLALDTSLLIYFLEGHPAYFDLAKQIMDRIESGSCIAATSVLTITELTVQPLMRNRVALATVLEARIANVPNLRIIDVDRAIAREAARIRAMHRVHVPDAIHLATAISFGADAFITNDHALRRFPDLRVVVLGDYVH